MRHKVKHVHFVGIGGSGMSGIAEVMHNLNFRVSGSDLSESAVLAHLRALGIRVHVGHAREHVSSADVVVTSTAVKAENPEVAAARAKRIPVVPRAMMLAELMRLKQGIAIAGTHGKTTTTSLIASVLAEAGMDPTFVIGGRLEAAGSHAKLGTGEFIVVEADESDASFLYLQPVLAVVTNIDADHMDTYGHDFGRLRQAFLEFVEHLPFYGSAVLCIDDDNVRSLLPIITKAVTTYGLSEAAHIRAVDIVHSAGQMRFRVVRRSSGEEPSMPDLRVTLNIPGEHNVRNALATIAVAMEVGVPDEALVRALAEFRGVGRRFQRYGEVSIGRGKKFTLIDDYGHHPAEIAPTIAAARGAFPGRRLVLAFQPHRYTRTRDCFEDFVHVLSTVDVLLLTEVYAAGESPIVAADGRALVRAVRVTGKVEPIFVEDVKDLAASIREVVRDGDVVITMGAGSIGTIPAALVSSETVTTDMFMAETTYIEQQALRGELRRGESMRRHTSWRTGGVVDLCYTPADIDDLSRFLRQLPPHEPLMFVGLGSNLLVRDGGLRGTVVFTHAALKGLELVERDGGEEIFAEAGVASPKVARFAAVHGFEGAEFFAGIPGTVGGALAMNAGCYGAETWEVVTRVRTIDRGGMIRERKPVDFDIAYRSVTQRFDGDEYFAAAWFRLQPGNGEKSRQRIKTLLQKRIASQPLEIPNAGSVFRNPPGDFAARLIESCGLKGLRRGGAMVSEKHANFIVNTSEAAAADIEWLIEHVQMVVKEKCGVELEREVRIVGEAAK